MCEFIFLLARTKTHTGHYLFSIHHHTPSFSIFPHPPLYFLTFAWNWSAHFQSVTDGFKRYVLISYTSAKTSALFILIWCVCVCVYVFMCGYMDVTQGLENARQSFSVLMWNEPSGLFLWAIYVLSPCIHHYRTIYNSKTCSHVQLMYNTLQISHQL